MEQDHSGAVPLVRVGDAGSVEGSESVHMRRRHGFWDLVRDLNRVAELGGDKIWLRGRVADQREWRTFSTGQASKMETSCRNFRLFSAESLFS